MTFIRVQITRLLLWLLERIAFDYEGDRTNIPGHYTKQEYAALNAVWKVRVARDWVAGKE